MVAAKLAVSVFVIVCTTTGAPPPMGTPPTLIWRFEGTEPVYETGWAVDLGRAQHVPVATIIKGSEQGLAFLSRIARQVDKDARATL
jgi:hypothetical protein